MKVLQHLSSLPLPVASMGAIPTQFRIFAAGKTETQTGAYTYDAVSAREIAAAEEHKQRKPWMDYEHQSLADPPIEQPCACTYDLDYRDDGLWAINVDWRPRAAKYLTEREYFSFSPAFYVEDGRVVELVNVALTNKPATKSQQPLVAATEEIKPTEESQMSKTLFTALGCPADATEAVALSEVVSLTDDRKALMALTEQKTAKEALGVIHAWKESHGQVVKLTEQLNALNASNDKRDVTLALEGASREGRLTPASVVKLSEQFDKGVLNKAAIAAMIEALPVMASQTAAVEAPKEAPATLMALTEDDKKFAKAFGHDVSKLAEFKRANPNVVSIPSEETESAQP